MGGFGREIPRFGNIPGKNCESITVARPPTPSCRAVCLPVRHCPNLGNRRLPALEARAACRRGAAETRRSGLQKTAGMAIPPDRERGIPWNAGPPSQMSGTPPASARPSARSSCARWARLSPGDTLVALVKPHYYEGRRGGASLQAPSGEGVLSSSPESDQIGTSIIDQRFPRLCGSGGLTAAGTC